MSPPRWHQCIDCNLQWVDEHLDSHCWFCGTRSELSIRPMVQTCNAQWEADTRLGPTNDGDAA